MKDTKSDLVSVVLAVDEITIAGEKITAAKGKTVQVTPEQAETMLAHGFIEPAKE